MTFSVSQSLDHWAYLAKAAFSKHLVEDQVVEGEAYPWN